MIHYINGVPAKNIKMNKTKRHALPHYRHTQHTAALRDTLARVAIVAALMIVLAGAFIIGTN